MRLSLLLLLHPALLAASCQAPDPVVFETELWPGEGRPQFEATGAALTLREAPAWSAPVATVMHDLQPGTPITFEQTRYRTMQPGHIAVLAVDTIRGRAMGDLAYLSREDYYGDTWPQATRGVTPGDTIDYLQYRAEGTCFVRIAGDVIDASPCPTYMGASFELLGEPDVAWWIQVALDDAPAGWVLVGDSIVAEVGRGF